MRLHGSHGSHWPVRPGPHWELATQRKRFYMRATRLREGKTLDVISTGRGWRVLIEMMETHIRSVASGPDRIHHRVDVFTGVSRIWGIDSNTQMLESGLFLTNLCSLEMN